MIIPTQEVKTCFGEKIHSFRLVGRGRDFEYNVCENIFELRSCNDGNIIFLNPMPTKDTLAIVYPPNYIPFHFHEMTGITRISRGFLLKKKAMAIMKLMKHKKDCKILDAGCGSGMLLRTLKDIASDECSLYGNDIAPEALRALRKEGIRTVVGNLDTFVTAERFDVITLLQVIEHVYDPLAVMRNLAALLNSNGYLFIETPSIDGVDAKIFSRGYWGGYHIPRHLWLFNEKSMRELIAQAGLTIVKIEYMPYPIFWIQSIHHLLLDKGYERLSRFFTHRNPVLLAFFTLVDVSALILRGKNSNMRIIAKKTAH